MWEEQLKRLDEIERLNPDPTLDTGALNIMDDMAQSIEGLHILVERYGDSSSHNIIGYLSFIIAKRAGKVLPGVAPIVFRFTDKMAHCDYPEALSSCLFALEQQLSRAQECEEDSRPSSSLFPFLQHCLEYSERQNTLVQYGAAAVLTTMCYRGFLDMAFDGEQLKWIIEKIEQLSMTESELLRDEVELFKACMTERRLGSP